jgi:hypothetical protein
MPRFSAVRVLLVMIIWVGPLGSFCAVVIPDVISALKILYGLLALALVVPQVARFYPSNVSTEAAMAAIVTGVSTTILIQLKTNLTGFGMLSLVISGVILVTAGLVVFAFFVNTSGERSE